MSDVQLAALLDPDGNGRGLTIQQVVGDQDADNSPDAVLSYYICGNVRGGGRSMWVDVLNTDSDAVKNTKIQTAFGVSY